MISGVLLGAPTLRVRGDYLAIVTLGFGEIIRLTAINSDWLGDAQRHHPTSRGRRASSSSRSRTSTGTAGTPLVDLDDTTTFLKFGVLDQIPYYWLALTVVIVVLFADSLDQDSRVGRAWEATREDEDAAELMGVPTFRFKLLAFAIGAFVGGLAGALFAGQAGLHQPRVVPAAAVDPVPRGGGARWPGQPLGRHRRRVRRRLPAGAVPRASPTAASWSSGWR